MKLRSLFLPMAFVIAFGSNAFRATAGEGAGSSGGGSVDAAEFQAVGRTLIRELSRIRDASTLRKLKDAVETAVPVIDSRYPGLRFETNRIQINRTEWAEARKNSHVAKRWVLGAYLEMASAIPSLFASPQAAMDELDNLPTERPTKPFCEGQSLEDYRDFPLQDIPAGTIFRFSESLTTTSDQSQIRYRDGIRQAEALELSESCSLVLRRPDGRALRKGLKVIALQGLARPIGNEVAYAVELRQHGIVEIQCQRRVESALTFERFRSVGFMLDQLRNVLQGCVPREIHIPREQDLEP